VNIHFTDPAQGEMEELSKTFRWVRMDFFWGGIERTKGIYDFSAYDRLMKSLDANRVRPIFILDYGNDLYGQGSPRTDHARSAFCNFISHAVSHFRHRGIVWEMWNEPNIGFWKPQPNADDYAALALSVGRTIRQVGSDEWYIGPATCGFDWNFLDRCFKAGLLGYWDAVSVHPYRQSAPETVSEDWDRLRTMIAAAEPAPRNVKMISGEWGYSDVWGGMNQKIQADYIARQYLANLLSGVHLSIWYDWKDDGSSRTDPEHHFGASRQDAAPKAAYEEASLIARQLRGFRFSRRIVVGEPGDYVLLFKKRNKSAEVAWTTNAPHMVRLPRQPSVLELSQTPRILER
jgi:hypothetical protein